MFKAGNVFFETQALNHKFKMSKYIFLFLFSFAFCLFLVPRIMKKAVNRDVVDKPAHRKVHRGIVPLWGGIPIYISFSGVIAIYYMFSVYFRAILHLNDDFLGKKLLGLILGGFVLVFVGAIDDQKGVPPKLKLLGQIVAALVVIAFGIRILGFNIPFVNYYVSFASDMPFWAMILYALSFSASLLWIVALINSMNFIDGLDGLAGGIAFIASAAFFALAVFKPSDTMMSTYVSVFIATVTAIFAGSLLGFLFYNVKPAKIFMGDGGSMFLGLMLSSLALIGSYKGLTAIMFFTPVLLLSVPIFDIVFAVIRRKLNGVPISKADKSHLHHRLLALGLSPLQAVIVLWAVAALFSVFAYLLV